MEGENNSSKPKRGCIKTTRNPWRVRREGRDGVIHHSWRTPSDKEREKNKLREKRRRKVTARIYACLKKFGNYKLPKHADQNDVLIALCEEAGWHVDEEGNIFRKGHIATATWSPPSIVCGLSEQSTEIDLSLKLGLSQYHMK